MASADGGDYHCPCSPALTHPLGTTMRARQVVIREPFEVEVREVDLPPPKDNQILVATEVSAVSPGTELAVYTGTHQWLKDPNLPDWKFPFPPGYSAAGSIVAVGSSVSGWQPGDRVSYPGNHASAELLTLGHEPDPRRHRDQRRQPRHRAGRLHRHASMAARPQLARLEISFSIRLQRRRDGGGHRRQRQGLESR